MVALCVVPPLVLVTVTGYMAGLAVPADSVNVELPLDVTLGGQKLLDAPVGTPVAARSTVPVTPPLPATDTTDVLDAPVAVDRDCGLADRLKSGDVAQPDTELPGKQISSTGWSSIWFGAAPV